MLNFLDVFDQFSIYSLLDVPGFGSPFSLSILSFLRFFVSGFRCILQLILGESGLSFEVRVINIAGDSINRDVSRCGNDICLVDSFKWDAIDGVRSSNQKVSGFEGFEDNNSSSSVSSRQKNDDLSCWDSFAGGSSGLVSSALIMGLFIVSWVPSVFLVSKFTLGSSTIGYVR